jgi:hypothetical protein
MAERITIWRKDHATMVSSWTEYIDFIKRKDGTVSFRHYSIGEDGTFSAGKTRIQSAQLFVETLLEMSETIRIEEIRDKICKEIEKVDSALSKKIREYIAAP